MFGGMSAAEAPFTKAPAEHRQSYNRGEGEGSQKEAWRDVA